MKPLENQNKNTLFYSIAIKMITLKTDEEKVSYLCANLPYEDRKAFLDYLLHNKNVFPKYPWLYDDVKHLSYSYISRMTKGSKQGPSVVNPNEENVLKAIALVQTYLDGNYDGIVDFCIVQKEQGNVISEAQFRHKLNLLRQSHPKWYQRFIERQAIIKQFHNVKFYDSNILNNLIEGIVSGKESGKFPYDIVDYYRECPFQVARLRESLHMLSFFACQLNLNSAMNQLVLKFTDRYCSDHFYTGNILKEYLLSFKRQVVQNGKALEIGYPENKAIIDALERFRIPLTDRTFHDMLYRYIDDRMPKADETSKGYMKRL